MRRLSHAFFWLLCLLMAGQAAQAQTDKRGVALVIGNGEGYLHTRKLKNAKADAVEMAKALRALNFDVIEGHDLNLAGMQSKLIEFSDRLNASLEVGLFYYAGHAIQTKGRNYLMPIDANVTKEHEVDFKMLAMSKVREVLETSQARTRLLFLDACRNDPFPGNTRAALSLAGGLASEKRTVGTYIAFSTDPGGVADDGDGAHSPFTTALLDRIKTVGSSVTDMMTLVKRDVRLSTQDRQKPWDESGLSELFFFVPGAATQTPVPTLDGGRQEFKKGNIANAKWHFEELAQRGNVEAMRERFLLAERDGEWDTALDWLSKAAQRDPQARLTWAWYAAHREQIGEVAKAWETRLTKAEAKTIAEALFKAGTLDAALLLQVLADEQAAGDDAAPLKFVPEITAAAARKHPGAMAYVAAKRRERLPAIEAVKAQHRTEVEQVLRLFEEAARLGSTVALAALDTEQDTLRLASHFKIARGLSDAERTALIVKSVGALTQATWGRKLANIQPSHVTPQETEEWLEITTRNYLAAGPARDPGRALVHVDALIAQREINHRTFRRGDRKGLYAARRLKAEVLAELGRHQDAVAMLLTTTETVEFITPLATLARKSPLTPQAVEGALASFKEHCPDLSFGNSAQDMSACETAAHAMVASGQLPLVDVVQAAVRTALTSDNGDTTETGRAYVLLAKLAEARPSVLSANETLRSLLTRAAALGATDAAEALRARNWPVPTVLPAVRIRSEGINIEGPWSGQKMLDGETVMSCRAWSNTAIITGGLKRKGLQSHELRLVATLERPTTGMIEIDTGAESAIQPESVRLFVSRDEFLAPTAVTGGVVAVTGDQSAFILRLRSGSMLRVEYRAANRNVVDVFSLEGFTNAHRALLQACPGLLPPTPASVATAPGGPVPVGPTTAAPALAGPTSTLPKQPSTAPGGTGVKSPVPAPVSKGPTPTAPAGPLAVMSLRRGQYFKGDGYQKKAGGSVEQCQADCASDQRCRAMEYQHTNLTCQLYDKVEPSFAARGTDVAVKQP